MKAKKEILILVAVIAALSVYLLVQKKGKTHYTLPELKPVQEKSISKVMITKGGSPLTLQKEDDVWLILPQRYPADSDLLENLLDEISGLTLTALASESRNYSLYELDDARRIDVEILGGDKTLRKVWVGKTAPSSRHTFVKLDDDPRVYHASGNLKSTFDKKASDLRDKKVLSIDEEITEITLKEGNKEMILVKSSPPVTVAVQEQEEPKKPEDESEAEENKPVYRWQTQNHEPAKEKEVKEIIQTLSNLQCNSFLEERTKEEFTNPYYTVTLKGVKTYSLSLFERKDNEYIGTSSSSEYVFLVPEWKARSIMKDLDALTEQKEE
jgi:hypothetical protein